jgi:hypothetical protein
MTGGQGLIDIADVNTNTFDGDAGHLATPA